MEEDEEGAGGLGRGLKMILYGHHPTKFSIVDFLIDFIHHS
jgi:hypothetical protein